MNRILIIITGVLLSFSVSAGIIKEKFPKIAISDALGTKQVSLKNFCLSADESTLVTQIRICHAAAFDARGYKECLKKPEVERIEVENSFTHRSFGPRGILRSTSYSYPRIIKVQVVDFDPRGSEEVLDEYMYEIPTCMDLQ